jgi:dynein assembly factor 2
VGKRRPEPAKNASAFSFDKAVKRPDTSPETKEPEGECEPKYSITHRDEGSDLSKGFGRGNSSNEVSKRRDTRPKHLVVRVTTPKIESIAGAELDVSERRLFFQVPGKYRLDIPLPFEVDGDEGKAKFDKSSRRLEVTLPVKPAKVEPPLRFTEPRMAEEDAKVDGECRGETPG